MVYRWTLGIIAMLPSATQREYIKNQINGNNNNNNDQYLLNVFKQREDGVLVAVILDVYSIIFRCYLNLSQ